MGSTEGTTTAANVSVLGDVPTGKSSPRRDISTPRATHKVSMPHGAPWAFRVCEFQRSLTSKKSNNIRHVAQRQQPPWKHQRSMPAIRATRRGGRGRTCPLVYLASILWTITQTASPANGLCSRSKRPTILATWHKQSHGEARALKPEQRTKNSNQRLVHIEN